MSVWARDNDGNRVLVNDEDIAAAESAGLTIEPGQEVTKRGIMGTASTISSEEAGGVVASGQELESAAERHERERETRIEEEFSGPGATVEAGLFGLARGASLGTSDILARALGADPWEMRQLRERQFAASLGGEVVGALGTGGAGLARTPAALATRAASRIGGRGAGGAVARGAAEGAIFGAGEGLSQVALSDDPLTVERVGAALTSNALYGAGIGAGAGLFAKAAEKGLGRARRMLDDAMEKRIGTLGETSDDLAKLDRKGLRQARDAEIDRVKAERLERGAQLAEELSEYRTALKEADNLYTLTKGAKKGSRLAEAGGRTRKALRQIRGALDTPADLAARPSQVRKALAQLDQTYKDLAEELPAIRKAVAAEGRAGGSRAKALDALEDLQARNAKLQADVADLTTPLRDTKTPRLEEIAAAQDALSSAPKGEGLGEKITKGGVFGAAMGGMSAIGVPPLVSLPLAGLAADKIGEIVFSRLGNASREVAERTGKAVSRALDVGAKVAKRSPMIATKVLTSTQLGPKQPEQKGSGNERVRAFRQRAAEISAQVQAGPTGAPKMTRRAHADIADQLRPVRAVAPLLADQMETLAARKVEFLADKLPRRPQLGFQTGPDRWRPTDSEISRFAKYVAAVEDPIAVVEGIADGSVSYQAAEALREVYPEIYADVQRQLIEQLPELREQLPFQRRMMLSVFFGVPVDPSMEPRIAAVLQGTHQAEPGTEGGTQAPSPNPQFGSVAKSNEPLEQPTPAQERAG